MESDGLFADPVNVNQVNQLGWLDIACLRITVGQPSLKIFQEQLDWHPGSSEARGTVHDIRIPGNNSCNWDSSRQSSLLLSTSLLLMPPQLAELGASRE